MIPVYQTKFGGSDAPEEEQGNCLAASLASIFELKLEEVPDFTGEINDGRWFIHLSDWLMRRNLYIVELTTNSEILGYHLIVADSMNLSNADDKHMLVGYNGKPVHNPRENSLHALSEYKLRNFWIFVPFDPSIEMKR